MQITPHLQLTNENTICRSAARSYSCTGHDRLMLVSVANFRGPGCCRRSSQLFIRLFSVYDLKQQMSLVQLRSMLF
jgi:hypothetical protein